MRKLILKNFQSPGDIVMLTAAVRDLHRNNPGKFLTDVRTSCPALWENNPFITPLEEKDSGVEMIECHYPIIHKSNQVPRHFLEGFMEFLAQRLNVRIVPTEFKGDIHLTDGEREWPEWLNEDRPSPPAPLPSDGRGWLSSRVREFPFWIIVAGGKRDFTIKWWQHERFQKVVDRFRGKILFVQTGEDGHAHRPLNGVLNLLGKTDARQFVRLTYHAQGVLCPVTLAMHLAAAVPVKELRVNGGGLKAGNRPCVVVAGGREPVQWEAYPGHQFIHTIGALPCCASGGCWRSRTVPLGDGDEKDQPKSLCVDTVGDLPRCMDMITAEDVIRRAEMYFEGGAVRYLSATERGLAGRIVEAPAEPAEREPNFA